MYVLVDRLFNEQNQSSKFLGDMFQPRIEEFNPKNELEYNVDPPYHLSEYK